VKIRRAVAVTLAVVFAGMVGIAQGPGRVVNVVVGPLDVVAVADPADRADAPLGPCNGFDMLEDVGFVGTFMDRFDKSGSLVQTIAKLAGLQIHSGNGQARDGSLERLSKEGVI
jgi:hypothetical protein